MQALEIAVPALPFVFVLMLTGSTAAEAIQHQEALHVACAQGRSFSLRIEGWQAHVQLANGDLILSRKPSSLGQHFRSKDATLILDEGFVAFAQKGDWDWQDCHVDPEFGS